MLLFDATRQLTACFRWRRIKQYPTSIAEMLSIMNRSSSPESEELLEAERTNAKLSEFNALRTQVLVPLHGGKSVLPPR
mgnify:FL=1